MTTYITVAIEGRKLSRIDVFDLEDLTDMRRYAKAMERCKKSGRKFEIRSVNARM